MTTLRKQMIRHMQLRGFTAATQKGYLYSVKCLAKYYNLSPDKLDGIKVQSYVLFLMNKRKLSASSVNKVIATLRFFYTQILQRPDIASALPPRKTGRRLPEILSAEELQRFFAVVRNRKHRTIYMTGYGAGVRVDEAVHLRVKDIDSDRMMIRIRNGKGQKDRYTILPVRLLKELRSYWKVERPKYWLFPGRKPGSPLTTNTVQQIFLINKKKAGIIKKVSFHTLRHCFCTHMLEAGMNIHTIQSLMGHSSIKTTAKYLHVTRKELAATKSPLDLLDVPDIKDLK